MARRHGEFREARGCANESRCGREESLLMFSVHKCVIYFLRSVLFQANKCME